MSIHTWILGAFAGLTTLGFGSFWLSEYRPELKISRRLRRILRRPPKNLANLNDRTYFDVEEFALIEKYVPRLRTVAIISNRVEEPTRSLADAVMDNFMEGARYDFFVSKDGNSTEEIQAYTDWFCALYRTAKGIAPSDGRHSAIHTTPFEKLFEIHRLPMDWPHVPYVFYSFQDTSDEAVTIALKGVNPGVGLSSAYLRVEPTEARALIDVCAQACDIFERTLKSSALDNTLPSAEVVPLRPERLVG